MTAEPAFSPEMEKALDTYAVPPLPAGFSDRLMTRITSGDIGVSTDSIALPASRLRHASPWRRTGRMIGSVVLFSLATATAAASGIFGEAVYVPGVSEALVEAKIVEAPKPLAKPEVPIIAESKAEKTTAEVAPATGSAAVVNRVAELRDNPEFVKLPPRQRLSVARREVRQMVRSGEVTRDNARNAMRELTKDIDPAIKKAWRQAAAERRERFRNASPEERAAIVQARRERQQARQQPLAPPTTADPADAELQ